MTHPRNWLSTVCVVGILSVAGASGCRQADAEELRTTAPEDLAGAAPLSDDSPAKPFVGKYRFVGGDDERAARDRAIDGVVSEMNMLSRGIARDKLTDSNLIPENLTFTGGADKLSISLDDRPYTGPVDGTSVKVQTLSGGIMNMKLNCGPELSQEFSDGDKGRVNRFELRGNKLLMHVRVHADQLPKELAYTLTFERVAS